VTTASQSGGTTTSKGALQVNKGKRYAEAVKGYDRDHLYSPVEAVDLVKSLAKAVSTRRRAGHGASASIHGARTRSSALTLTAGGNGAGCTRRCLCRREQAAEARAAGADVVGADDLVLRSRKRAFWHLTSPSPRRI